MAYDTHLADRVRNYLAQYSTQAVEEKEMFRGLAFLVNDKMCINISGDRLLCRFDPARQPEVEERPGYLPMIMKGKELAGYCLVEPQGCRSSRDLAWWMQLCLEFNPRAKSSKRKGK
ncbi:MAG: TfoX family protein [Chitinophagaceae bacterium]|nr:MAG: TfoX family protein [Chitinophagaceae bacterium]